MAGEDTPAKGLRISPKEFESLSAENLEALRQKHGLEIELKSSKAGVQELLNSLGRVDLSAISAEHERGFDRTDPGYSRSYDREVRAELPDVVDPAELATRIRSELGPGGGP